MAANSKISWTEATWNPLAGCTPISPGCLHCYAATMARRLEAMGQAKYAGTAERRGTVDVFTGKITIDEAALQIPLKRKKPTVYFVNSMSDLFHESVPFEFVDRVFAVMNMTTYSLPLPKNALAAQPWHIYQVLTKRPERMANYIYSRCGIRGPGKHPLFKCRDLARGHGLELMNASAVLSWPLSNVWLGVSVEDRQRLERIDVLRTIPAAVRFVSFEPLLEDLREIDLSGIHWAITGGESGPHARAHDLAWSRSIGQQCTAAGVSWWHKQMGSHCIARWDDPAIADLVAHGICTERSVQLHDDWKISGIPADPLRGRIHFAHRKGEDLAEWPPEFRVQQMPEVQPCTQ